MQPHLIQLAEHRDDGDGEQAADLRVERVIQPCLAPCAAGHELLEWSGKRRRAIHDGVHMVVTEHRSPDGQGLLEAIIHVVLLEGDGERLPGPP